MSMDRLLAVLLVLSLASTGEAAGFVASRSTPNTATGPRAYAGPISVPFIAAHPNLPLAPGLNRLELGEALPSRDTRPALVSGLTLLSESIERRQEGSGSSGVRAELGRAFDKSTPGTGLPEGGVLGEEGASWGGQGLGRFAAASGKSGRAEVPASRGSPKRSLKPWRSRLLSALLLALSALSPACAFIPSYQGPPQAARGPESPPALVLRDFRGVIHAHSHLSYDSIGTEQEMVEAANRVGLDFLIMTDHYSERGVTEAIRGLRGRTLFLAGAEISKDKGSLIALGLERPLDHKGSAAQVARQVHAQGGLVFIGHLEEYAGDLESFPFDGFEIYNLHAAARLENPALLGLRALFSTPDAFFPSLLKPWPANLELWSRWLERRPVPVIAGNDAHKKKFLLGSWVATYEQVFRSVTTHVWAKSLSREEILGALREGRSYVAFEGLRDATGFSVTPVERQGRLFWRVYAPEKASIVMRLGSRVVGRKDGQWLEVPIAAPDKAYRVEVFLSGRPWIIAGPFIHSSGFH